MKTTHTAFLHDFRFSWRKMLLLRLLALATLTPPAFLLAQNPARGIKFEHLGLEQGLSQSSVYCILQDHQGFMWFGTQEGLNKYDGYRFTVYKHDVFDSTSLLVNVVGTAIFEDHTHTLWVGTWGGGHNRFDREKEQFTRFVYDPNNPHSLSHNRVNAIHEDRSETLWIGTSAGGLNRFDCDTERFTNFVHDPKNPHSLSHNNVTAVIVDHTGTLWVGTWGGGLNRFDRKGGQFTHYTENDGLANNTICGILEDARDRLWLSTNNGLSYFDPRTKTFRNYGLADGLSSNEFTLPAYHKSHRGEMFFGSFNGFIAFHPDSIKDNPYIPPVVISATTLMMRKELPSPKRVLRQRKKFRFPTRTTS